MKRVRLAVLGIVALAVATAWSQPPDPPRNGGPGGPPRGLEKIAVTSIGVQWFATLASGLREAERMGRPILLVAAAPHCGGVSGVW